MRKHINVYISDRLSKLLDDAAAKRGLDRSKFVRWALERVLSKDEPYVYAPPTLPNWQAEAWTLLLRGLFGDERLVLTAEVKPLLVEAINKLNEREAQILRLRFGLFGLRRTLEETGAIFGVRRSRAHQVEAQALRRMRYLLRGSGIWELLEGQLDEKEEQ